MSAPYDSLVEYISSSGTQYIDTGYAFADGFAFEVDFRYATSNATVFGARASSVCTAVVYYSVTNGLVVNMAGYSGSSTPFKFAGATVTDRHVLKMEVSGGVGTTWLDGVKVHDAVSFSGAYISGVTQAIFATKYGDNDFRDISATTIYGVRMWQGGTLVRDYVPARVGTGGELYDRVSGTLAARVGTLTAGPDKAEPVPSPVGIGGTMLIAARESFAAAARKRLPYDAEVEYLQSSGTQYIDTGVGGGSDTDFELNVMMPSSIGRQIAGARSASSNYRYVQIQSNPLGNIYFGYDNSTSFGSYKTLSGWMTLRATGNNCYVDDVLLHTFSAAQFASAGTIWLHATHGASAQGTAALRISTARIWSGGTLVRDYVPVRVGSGSSAVGYMYDRVSGALFANAGTGAFTIGPDKN